MILKEMRSMDLLFMIPQALRGLVGGVVTPFRQSSNIFFEFSRHFLIASRLLARQSISSSLDIHGSSQVEILSRHFFLHLYI